MITPPLINDDVVDYWRYVNRCNPDGTRTPLSRSDITRLFLLEERLQELGIGFDDLRELLGLGKGIDGDGIPSRAEVREQIAYGAAQARQAIRAETARWLAGDVASLYREI
jgi:hypothetical protein